MSKKRTLPAPSIVLEGSADERFTVTKKYMPRFTAEYAGHRKTKGTKEAVIKWLAWKIRADRYVKEIESYGDYDWKIHDENEVGCFKTTTKEHKGKILREINEIGRDILKTTTPIYPYDVSCPECGWAGFYCECEVEIGEESGIHYHNCPNCHDYDVEPIIH